METKNFGLYDGEEKAKRYDEALEKAKNYHKQLLDEDNPEWASEIEKIFPELKESEDERIRKKLIAIYSVGAKVNAKTGDIPDRDIVAWLEKQGEQKPNWNEDETSIAINHPKAYRIRFADGEAHAKEEKPTEWSEDDKERIKNILSVLDAQVCWDGATMKKRNPYQKEIDWLKSLRPQNRKQGDTND